MLYDPKWEVEQKADPLSLEALISWLEKQPATEQYDYICAGACLLHRYAKSIGMNKREATNFAGETCINEYFRKSDSVLGKFNSIAIQQPHTFGHALERARALVPR